MSTVEEERLRNIAGRWLLLSPSELATEGYYRSSDGQSFAYDGIGGSFVRWHRHISAARMGWVQENEARLERGRIALLSRIVNDV